MLNYYINIAPNESVVKETGITWWDNTVEEKKGSSLPLAFYPLCAKSYDYVQIVTHRMPRRLVSFPDFQELH
jgi:hypothetical protein